MEYRFIDFVFYVNIGGVEMSEARDKYYKGIWDVNPIVTNYITELEQQQTELIEFVEKEKAMAEGYFDYKPKDVILRCDHILKRCK